MEALYPQTHPISPLPLSPLSLLLPCPRLMRHELPQKFPLPMASPCPSPSFRSNQGAVAARVAVNLHHDDDDSSSVREHGAIDEDDFR